VRAIWIALALAGCSKSDREATPPPSQTPPPVTAAEKQRGVAACADYKIKVCECAGRRPDLAEQCRMADARVAALEMSLELADAAADTGEADSEKALAISNARKVMRKCIEEVAQLARGCAALTPEAEMRQRPPAE
jgi:hypothetical protein